MLGRDADGRPEWNRRLLDLSLRIGFELRVCQPYRAQTKGKVESGVKYVRGNLWSSVRFTDDMDLNRQFLKSCDAVANRRVHGTRGRRPWECARDYVAWRASARNLRNRPRWLLRSRSSRASSSLPPKSLRGPSSYCSIHHAMFYAGYC